MMTVVKVSLFTCFVCLLECLLVDSAETNLIQNPGFEEELSGSWGCADKCDLVRSTDAFAGVYSARVTNRTSDRNGIRQDVETIKPSAKYYMEARVKMINQVSDSHQIQMVVYIRGDKTARPVIATQNYMRPCDGWILIGGDFVTLPDTTKVTAMTMVSNEQGVDYLVDTFSLTEIIPDPNWRENADARIDAIRKGNIRINTQIKEPLKVKNMVLWINQTRQSFPFGSAIIADRMFKTDDVSRRFQEYFYSMFNWAVVTNAMKWRFMESREGQPYFGTVDQAVDALIANNITNIRGHCIAWAKSTKILSWLKTKSPAGIAEGVYNRISYMAQHYRGKMTHWDVNNEMLHGNWYRENTNNPQFPEGMFHDLHHLDGTAKLMTNDYDALSKGVFTSAYKRQISQYLANGVPISAVGLQSHLSVFPDMDIFKKRLDMVASAGLPLWITELDVRSENVTERAIGYENVYRLFYSQPSISGILMWGFQNTSMAVNTASLCDGDDMKENEAGARVRNLLRNEWRSEIVEPMKGPRSQSNTYRVFHGTHDIYLLYEGQVMWNTTVELRRGQDLEIDVTLP